MCMQWGSAALHLEMQARTLLQGHRLVKVREEGAAARQRPRMRSQVGQRDAPGRHLPQAATRIPATSLRRPLPYQQHT